MLAASFCCRRNYSPLRFRIWLLMWMVAAVGGLVLLYAVLRVGGRSGRG